MLKPMTVSIVYIALDQELNRIEFMEDWLSAAGISFERVTGVQIPDVLAVERYDRSSRLKKFGYDLTPAEIGCYLAHRKCWLYAKEADRLTLVLESDVAPHAVENFGNLVRSIQSVEGEFDLLRLHGIFENNELFLREIVSLEKNLDFKVCQSLGDPMGAGGYVLTPFAASRLLQKSDSFYEPVDVFLAATWRHKLRFRVLKPYPLKLKEFESVIGERRRPKQSLLARLRIELARASNDMQRIMYSWRAFWK